MDINWTTLLLAVIAGVFATIKLIADKEMAAHIKNVDDAAVLGNAVDNSLGALEQAAKMEAAKVPVSHIAILGVPAELAAGVQYVLDHAGTEAKSLGITPEAIAAKINAKIGLAAIASNIQSAAAPGPTVAPLTPLPLVVKGAPVVA